ncbi:MAG: M16 family metallopeptidase [Candidatus Aminicenantia bacterium]
MNNFSIPIKPLFYKKLNLENGLKVILFPRKKLPFINFYLLIGVGAGSDSSEKQGLTYLTLDLLVKGTERKNALQIATDIEYLGGYLTSFTTMDYSVLSEEFLAKDMKEGVEIFCDVLLNPSFPEKEFKKAIDRRLDSLKEEKDNSVLIASREFFRHLFKNHPYSNIVKGTEESLSSLRREDVITHYQNFCGPENSILIIIGDLGLEFAEEIVNEYLTSWKRKKTNEPNILPPSKINGKEVIIMNKPDLTQSQIRIGNIGFPKKHQDYFPALVANTIFGGSFTSRLISEIRVKKGLTYSITSNFLSFREGGAFFISTFTKNRSTFAVVEAILKEIKRMKSSSISKQELYKAKKCLQGIFPLKFETNEAIAYYLGESEFYGLDAKFIQNYYQKIEQITVEEIQMVTEKYFDSENFCLFVLSRAKEVEDDLRKIGKVKII